MNCPYQRKDRKIYNFYAIQYKLSTDTWWYRMNHEPRFTDDGWRTYTSVELTAGDALLRLKNFVNGDYFMVGTIGIRQQCMRDGSPV